MANRFQYTIHLLWYIRMPLILNTYQGVRNSYELQSAKINSDSSFRLKYRKPFKKVCSIVNKINISRCSNSHDK